MSVTSATKFEISHKGDVRPAQLESAIDKIRVVADRCREDVRMIEVRLMLESKPALRTASDGRSDDRRRWATGACS